MQSACDRFGNPERSFQAVHIAGTNGKGSTAAFLANMAPAAGRRVGLYTSPHLVKFTERIQVGGQPISDDVAAELIERVLDAAPELTFFEVTTLVAFLAFKEAGVDFAVLEVGLGGRLDATNVIPPPLVAVITRVAYDHMDVLGNSLQEIGREKAGIIKSGSKVVCGRLHPDARAEVEARAQAVGAEILPLGSPEPIPGAPLGYPRIAMLGTNLAVAVTAGRALGFTAEQLARGVEATHWPGRNELLHRNGQDVTLLDCAHNPDGAVTLSHMLDPSLLAEIDSRRDIALVFGSVEGKSWKPMLRRLENVAFNRVYVAPPLQAGRRKGVPPEEMAAFLKGETAPSVADALVRARELVGHGGVVVVTGSCFLVGAARALLLGMAPDPAIDM